MSSQLISTMTNFLAAKEVGADIVINGLESRRCARISGKQMEVLTKLS